MRYLQILIFLIFCSVTMIGQSSSGTISGQLIDEATESGIGYASISVINVADSSVETGSLSEENGMFLLEDVPYGEYFINISYIGYSEIDTEPFMLSKEDKNFSLGKFTMGSSTQRIDDVVITGRKAVIETRLDKKVFNASQDISSQSGDALEVLRNVPSVEVDQDGNISLRGSQNVRILIDGRPSSFTVSDLLRQMPASAIEKVEIITNPGAKFNPEGTAGILNIILKKEDSQGFNGNVNVGFTQATYSSYNAGIGINWRTQHFNTYANYGFTDNQRFSGGSRSKHFLNAPQDSLARIITESDGFRTRGGHNAKVGMDIYINKRNTLYWSGAYRKSLNPGGRTIDYRFLDQDYNILRTSQRITDELDDDNNYNLNLGWKKKFIDPEHVLEVDLSYDKSAENEIEDYSEEIYTSDFLIDEEYQKQDEIEDEAIFIGRIDYVRPLNNKGVIEGGARYDFTQMNNNLNTYDSFNGGESYELNKNLSNVFDYKENTGAVYATYGQTWEKFGAKVGVRLEHTQQSIQSNQDSIPYEYRYTRPYPSVHLSYSTTETESWLLSFSRRINRPSPWRLNPFTDFSDPYNLRSGNPYLKPEDIYSAELGYLKYWDKVTLNLTGYFKQINDVHQRFSNVDESTGITRFTYENIGSSNEYGLEFMTTYRPLKWWNITLSGNAYQSELSNIVSDNVSNKKAFRFSTQANSQMTFKHDLAFQVSGRYRAPFNSPQGSIYAFTSVDVGLSKMFLDKALTVSLSARDIFNTMRFKYDLNSGPNVEESMEWQWDSRSFGVSLSYNFGKQFQKDGKSRGDNRNGGGDMDMMGM